MKLGWKKTEERARQVLLSMGYLCDVARREVKRHYHPRRGYTFSSSTFDFFGCIDIMAKRPMSPTRWVQVTEDSSVKRKMLEIQDLPIWSHDDVVEIWKPAQHAVPHWRIWKLDHANGCWVEVLYQETPTGCLAAVESRGRWKAIEGKRELVPMDMQGAP
jgi:hypothetical protein